MPLSNPSSVPIVSSSAPQAAVTIGTTASDAIAANANRKGASIWNAGSTTIYVGYKAATTATDYAFVLFPGGYAELPFGYTGIVRAIGSATGGSLLVSEFV